MLCAFLDPFARDLLLEKKKSVGQTVSSSRAREAVGLGTFRAPVLFIIQWRLNIRVYRQEFKNKKMPQVFIFLYNININLAALN